MIVNNKTVVHTNSLALPSLWQKKECPKLLSNITLTWFDKKIFAKVKQLSVP